MSVLKHGFYRRGGGAKRAPWPREVRIYNAMRTRCLNPNSARYADYGGRGIAICDRWLNGDGDRTGLECFLADMGRCPTGWSLDRIDNDGPYEPGNCRWADARTQARNARTTRFVAVRGETLPLPEAVERFGSVSVGTARMRLHRGWPEGEAITAPKGARPSKRIGG